MRHNTIDISAELEYFFGTDQHFSTIGILQTTSI